MRVTIVYLLSIFSIGALIIACATKDRKYSYIAVYVFVVVIAGLPFQPVTRYIWPIYPLFACLAFDGGSRLFVYLKPVFSSFKKLPNSRRFMV